ncbi:predicted protein [Chaetomium globosum CBS 148.51]|uniref:Uncharacterized protein n=1 Tax=Chaetomium globosum (strain ATCC 6205 / CBS 148.51 / DSM 1962 / NBRC 6347 / NRRL 1970) TaxID=306901 RepID=Q2GRL4_CHAGB|nr:uncharacterized protein CHGG_09390 [Chaetomium globosum CBS 148.51]EAQ85376.1 predicted protein [Chaetomium globosum CBS 148.51]
MTSKSLPNFGPWGDNGNGSGSQTENASRNSDVLSPKESLANFSPPATPTPAISTPPSTTGSYDVKGDNRELVQPERSQIFRKYFSAESSEGQGWAVLCLRMTPDPGARCYKKAPWAALLEVRTADMPRLMRDGFFWSAENILPEEGHVSRETSPLWADFGFYHKRTWVLADRSNDEVPRWVGCLHILTPSFEILPSFQVQQLKPENAGGRGQEKKRWTVWVSDLRTSASVALSLARLRKPFPYPRNLNIFNILINGRRVVSFCNIGRPSYSQGPAAYNP